LAYKRRMGYVPEEPYLYAHLSGLEYLTMVGQLRGLPPSPRPIALMACCGYSRSTATGTRPSRITRKYAAESAALGRAAHNPDLILLDEPFSGLDVGTALVLRSLIQELAARGKVVLFSSHELETVERVLVARGDSAPGKIVADDSIERLRTLMALPTLEDIFSQLAVEQDTRYFTRDCGFDRSMRRET